MLSAAKKSMVGDAISEQGAVFAGTIGSRLRQVSSRHDVFLENLDRTDKPTAGKQASLESTTKKTMERMGQSSNTHVKSQEKSGKDGDELRAVHG